MDSNPFGAVATLTTPHGRYEIARLDRLEQSGLCTLARLPFSLRVLLEAVLRQVDGRSIT